MVIDNTDRTHEAGRLAAFFDESEKESLDRLSRLAAGLVAAPVAFIVLSDLSGRVCVGSSGVPDAWVSRNEVLLASLADLALPLVIADAHEHRPLQDNPALRELGMTAGLCLPLKAPNDQHLGTMMVVDTQPRDWTRDEINLLTDLAATAGTERMLHSTASVTEPHLRATVDAFPLPAVLLDASGNVRSWNAAAERILGWRESEVVGRPCPAVPENQRDTYNRLFARVAG